MDREERAALVERLRTLVRIPTVSTREPAELDTAAFDEFIVVLGGMFPLLHTDLELTRIDGYGLLFRWRGRSDARPAVLMAHLDVVPAGPEEMWRFPPFSAEVADGAIWGRGTLDDKSALTAVCSAVERLLAQGFTPEQDVWLSFGCDEEVLGTAASMAVAELRRQGVRPWIVLDEGGAVVSGTFPGLKKPLAVVAVAEKGRANLQLEAKARGGHPMTPQKLGATARLARAVVRLDNAPFKPRTPAPTMELLERISPHLPQPVQGLISRAAKLSPIITRALIAAGPESAAMVRTTAVTTTLSGSPTPDMLATEATAGVNVRIMPGDSMQDVLHHVRRAIKDPEVKVSVLDAFEPAPISPRDDTFQQVIASIERVYPDAVAAPFLLSGVTDSRHFTEICHHVYRFTPFRMTKEQREGVHSFDERIGIDDFIDGVVWYEDFIRHLT